MKKLAVWFCLVTPSFSQSYLGAGAYGSSAHPYVTGWAAYLRPVSGDRLYGMATVDVYPARGDDGRWYTYVNVGAGTAVRLFSLGQYGELYGTGDAAASIGGGSMGIGAAGGILYVVPLKDRLCLTVPVRYANANNSAYRITAGVGIMVKLE